MRIRRDSRQAVNKVIHRNFESVTKLFEINHLTRISQIDPTKAVQPSLVRDAQARGRVADPQRRPVAGPVTNRICQARNTPATAHLCTKFVQRRRKHPHPPHPCYKSNSEAKWLIYMKFTFCYFCRQLSQSLDSCGFDGTRGELSTKLSTEILNPARNALKSSA